MPRFPLRQLRDPQPRTVLGSAIAIAAVLLAAAIAYTAVTACGRPAQIDPPALPSQTPTMRAEPGPPLTMTPACAGLSGPAVGITEGTQNTRTGTIYALYHAIHVQRDAGKLFALLHPDTHITAEAADIVIGHYPPGTQYCLAFGKVTPDAIWVTVTATHPQVKYLPSHQVITLTDEAPYRVTGIYNRYGIPTG